MLSISRTLSNIYLSVHCYTYIQWKLALPMITSVIEAIIYGTELIVRDQLGMWSIQLMRENIIQLPFLKVDH